MTILRYKNVASRFIWTENNDRPSEACPGDRPGMNATGQMENFSLYDE